MKRVKVMLINTFVIIVACYPASWADVLSRLNSQSTPPNRVQQTNNPSPNQTPLLLHPTLPAPFGTHRTFTSGKDGVPNHGNPASRPIPIHTSSSFPLSRNTNTGEEVSVSLSKPKIHLDELTQSTDVKEATSQYNQAQTPITSQTARAVSSSLPLQKTNTRPSGPIARKPSTATNQTVATAEVVVPYQGNVPTALLGTLQHVPAITSQGQVQNQANAFTPDISPLSSLSSASLALPPILETVNEPIDALFDMAFNMPLDLGDMGGIFPVEDQGLDWTDFFNDAETEASALVQPVPLPDSPAGTATPKSTESEQSEALDYIPSVLAPASPPDPNFDIFNFDFAPTHVEDPTLFSFLDPPPVPPIPPAYQPTPDPTLHSDPTMKGTFGLDFGSFGIMTGLGDDAASLLGLTGTDGVMQQYEAPKNTPQFPSVLNNPGGLQNFIANIDWKTFGVIPNPNPQQTTIHPSQLVSPRPDLKRKNSSDTHSVEASPAHDGPIAKKPRGRPPKPKTTPTLPLSRRLSTLPTPTSTQTQSLHLSPPTSPKSKQPNSSTARPKSVVPEKFFKDNHAQILLGMTKAQICSYPTFEDLLADVIPELRVGAEVFGQKIAEGRDRAKDAAKKSRDEKRGLIVGLEERVGELEDEVKTLKGVLMGLVERGVVGMEELGEVQGLGLHF